MDEGKPDGGWRSWSLLEWLLFGSVWAVVGAHLFMDGVAASPLWVRAGSIGVTVLLGLWVVGVLSRDPRGATCSSPCWASWVSSSRRSAGESCGASFYQEWAGAAPILLGIQLAGSLVALVTGSLLYSCERARVAAGEEAGPIGPASQERRS